MRYVNLTERIAELEADLYESDLTIAALGADRAALSGALRQARLEAHARAFITVPMGHDLDHESGEVTCHVASPGIALFVVAFLGLLSGAVATLGPALFIAAR